MSCALSIFADKVCAAFPQRVITRTLPLHAAVPVYIAAIAGAEASIAFASVSLGVVLEALVVLVALNHYLLAERGADASETDRLRSHEVLLALPLVPLLRISDLTMTVKGVPLLGEYALVGLPVLGAAAWVSVKFLMRYFQSNTLTPFAVYCLLAGLAALLVFVF